MVNPKIGEVLSFFAHPSTYFSKMRPYMTQVSSEVTLLGPPTSLGVLCAADF